MSRNQSNCFSLFFHSRQKLDLLKQANGFPNAVDSFVRTSMSNPIARKAIEDFEDLQATSSARASSPSSLTTTTTTTTNNQLGTDVNHLTRGNGRGEEKKKEEEGNESAIDTSHMKQEKKEEQLQRRNIVDSYFECDIPIRLKTADLDIFL